MREPLHGPGHATTMAILAFLFVQSVHAARFHVEAVDLTAVETGWGHARRNLAANSGPLRAAGSNYARGIGTHACSRLRLALDGKATRFSAVAAIDDYAGPPASMEFVVRGYGPVSMQQYNSWNGIVWINDPDHCDVSPKVRGVGKGNVLETEAVEATPAESVIRPALASIAGTMLMLSDKVEVYRDDRNLFGAKRASPVPWSVPGQLYDFDPRKTEIIRTTRRTEITSGSGPGKVDADRTGKVCSLWLNEFDLGFDHWHVLHRLNWTAGSQGVGPLPETTIDLADLGLDPAATYLLVEFLTGARMVSREGKVTLPSLGPMRLQSYAIRAQLERPRLLSTSRHLSHGAVDLEALQWTPETRALAGRSRVIGGDPYVITVHIPTGFTAETATVEGRPVSVEQRGRFGTLAISRPDTASTAWQVRFRQNP